MPATTLHQLALRAIAKNISTLESVGDLPYDFCRPFLVKVENPDQLRRIEVNSPKIIGEDAELWKAFCKRDVPHYERYADEPSNPKSWWKFYRYVKRKDEEENAIQEAKLRQTMEKLNKQKIDNKAAISDNLYDTRRRKSQYSNHPASFNRLRRQAVLPPRKVQLPPHLMAERKAMAQRKLGQPDEAVPLPRRKLQNGTETRVMKAPSGLSTSRQLGHSRAGASSVTPRASTATRQLSKSSRPSFDDLFDEDEDEDESSSPLSSPPPPQPTLPTGARAPPPKAAASPGALKKRKREVNVFMPPKKK